MTRERHLPYWALVCLRLFAVQVVMVFVLMLVGTILNPVIPATWWWLAVPYTLLIMVYLSLPSLAAGVCYAALVHGSSGVASRRKALWLSPIAFIPEWIGAFVTPDFLVMIVVVSIATAVFGLVAPLPDERPSEVAPELVG